MCSSLLLNLVFTLSTRTSFYKIVLLQMTQTDLTPLLPHSRTPNPTSSQDGTRCTQLMQSVLWEWTTCEHLIQTSRKMGLIGYNWYRIFARWDWVCTRSAEDVVRLDWWWTLDTILLRDGTGGGQIVQDLGKMGLSVRRWYVKLMLNRWYDIAHNI